MSRSRFHTYVSDEKDDNIYHAPEIDCEDLTCDCGPNPGPYLDEPTFLRFAFVKAIYVSYPSPPDVAHASEHRHARFRSRELNFAPFRISCTLSRSAPSSWRLNSV